MSSIGKVVSGFFGAPKPPPPPPPPPVLAKPAPSIERNPQVRDATAAAEEEAARRKKALKAGQVETILTGGQGLGSSGQVSKRTLLGG